MLYICIWLVFRLDITIRILHKRIWYSNPFDLVIRHPRHLQNSRLQKAVSVRFLILRAVVEGRVKIVLNLGQEQKNGGVQFWMEDGDRSYASNFLVSKKNPRFPADVCLVRWMVLGFGIMGKPLHGFFEGYEVTTCFNYHRFFEKCDK